jgi:hypothetical protein
MGKPDLGKLGKWADPTTKAGRQRWAYVPGFGPMMAGMGYYIEQGKDLVKAPKLPNIGAPPPPVDITDKAVQAKRREEEFRTGTGSRRNSFITGPMGDQTSIPVLGKSVITGG